jgi:alkanesulfonate monooxygenase SsuD/methylene tetrahydromethanopterin reductase-like flavin-dependent oxidoreductase (luciferase family)
VELAGEIADGWLGLFFAPASASQHLAGLRAGRAKVAKSMDGFDVCITSALAVGDDLAACADQVRRNAALYIGGMGSREQNFYNDLAVRMGYPDAAADVQRRYLSRDYEGAAAAVPLEFLDSTSLLGPVDRIAERLAELAAAGVTTVSVSPYGPTLDVRMAALTSVADALERSGVRAKSTTK